VADDDADIRRLLLDAGAVRFGRFVLTSGATSDVYVDIKQVWTRPERLRPLARALAARTGDAELLAGMELGAVPLVVATALATGLPYVVVRKPGRAHGTARPFEGEIAPGARTLLLEDVTTTGGSLVATVGILREGGARVDRAVTVVDREQGGAEQLRAHGVHLEWLARLSELRGRGP
jgi:orotate phosphoribosyltransferase